MQLSQNSNVNFKGIEFTVPRAPRGTVREALDEFREHDSLIQYLEDELGADVFTKVTADGKLEMQLGAKFHKSYWEEPEEIKRTLKIVPIVDSKGKPIKATINPTDKKQNWMRKIDNFVDKLLKMTKNVHLLMLKILLTL